MSKKKAFVLQKLFKETFINNATKSIVGVFGNLKKAEKYAKKTNPKIQVCYSETEADEEKQYFFIEETIAH